MNSIIPGEYRAVAEDLFPAGGESLRADALAAFADILGIGAEFRRILCAPPTGPEMRTFLGHFQNNLDLLIQKTWVAQADLHRKERLQKAVPGFIAGFEHGDYQRTVGEFAAILDELFYLFFGAQSRKPDFSVYIFRVDPQIGLFWWYGAQIGRLRPPEPPGEPAQALNNDSLWMLLLIGICYLTNF